MVSFYLQGARNNPKDIYEFLKEATMMKNFKHPNVLSLYGVVFILNRPYVIIPFMAHGDLHGYVSNPRNVSRIKFKVLYDYIEDMTTF